MHVTVVGSKGRIGQVMEGILTSASHTVSGIDQENRDDLEVALASSDVVLLALPISQALEFMDTTDYEGVVVEVASVKLPLLPHKGRIVSIHPLFGPKSYPENRTICLVSDISRPDSVRVVKDLFPSCSILEVTLEQHEKLMLTSLVAPYLLSLLSKELGGSNPALTRSGGVMKLMSGLLDDENQSVVMDTIKLNPNTPELLQGIESFLQTFMEVEH